MIRGKAILQLNLSLVDPLYGGIGTYRYKINQPMNASHIKMHSKSRSIKLQKIVAIAVGNNGIRDVKLWSRSKHKKIFERMANSLLAVNISGSPAVAARWKAAKKYFFLLRSLPYRRRWLLSIGAYSFCQQENERLTANMHLTVNMRLIGIPLITMGGVIIINTSGLEYCR